MAWQPEYMINLQLDAASRGDVLAAACAGFAAPARSLAVEAQPSAPSSSPQLTQAARLPLTAAPGARPLVVGAGDDRIATPRDVKATATVYGVKPVIVPGLAHMMMLDDDWLNAAQPVRDWLATLKA